jgi:putative PIN family toxin of toxin-antitoxin system
LRIVLDSTVLVRAHPASQAAGRKALMAVLDQSHTLVLSNPIIVETIRVLRYPRFQKIYALADDALFEYAQFLHEASQIVPLDQGYAAPLRDPADMDVLQTAERGDCDILCSNDSDFHDEETAAYCADRGIIVYTEATFLALMRSKQI